ncbi:MAG: ferredoxin [Chloroflexota bacterium]|nr:ferredoxin [Chloroflexota bacterium]
MTTAPRVTIDPDLCIGSGDCVRLVPLAFRIDESRGVSTPLPGAATADPDLLAEAAFNCPTHAIEVSGAER